MSHTLKVHVYRYVFAIICVAIALFSFIENVHATQTIVSWDTPGFVFPSYAEGSSVTISGSAHYYVYPPQVIYYSIDGGAYQVCVNYGSPGGTPLSYTFSCAFAAPPAGSHTITLRTAGCVMINGITCYVTDYFPRNFSTVSMRPTTSTLSPTNISLSGARMNGLVDLKGETVGTAWFRYDTVSTNLNCPTDSGGIRTADIPLTTSYVSFNTLLSGLTTGVTYYYCAIASNAYGTHAGGVQSFTTNWQPPQVFTNAPSVTSATEATLRGSVNPNGTSAIGWFRYKKSPTSTPVCTDTDTYGTRVPASGGVSLGSGTTSVQLSVGISGLELNARYIVCAFASNSVGTTLGNTTSFIVRLPNLTSGAISLRSGTLAEGNSVRFRSSVRQSGGNTPAPPSLVTNNLRYRWESGVWNTLGIGSPQPISLPSGTSSQSYDSVLLNLTQGGTLEIENCADSISVISESNELDNCATQTFAVTGTTPPPPLLSTPELTAPRRIVTQGATTSLSWDTNNANESLCTLSGGSITTNPLTPISGDAEVGSVVVTVLANTTYTLTCPHGNDAITIEIVPRGFET